MPYMLQSHGLDNLPRVERIAIAQALWNSITAEAPPGMLTEAQARELVEDSIGFHKYTEPMRQLIRDVAESSGSKYFVSSAHPRLVEGKPSARC